MSYTVKDSIGGRRIRLVYDAGLATLPAGGRRFARSRQAGRHMRQHRARAALFVRPGANVEHWWAAREPGILFAAGIMQWLHGDSPEDGMYGDGAPLPGEEEKPADFHVLIPLDSRVYVATVTGRMIADERVLPPDQALAHVAGGDASGMSVNTGPVFAWQAGDRPAGTAGEVDRVVPLEQAPFALGDIRLQPLWLSFARSGLVHGSHFVLGSLALMSVLGLLLLRPAMEIAGEVDLADNPVESIVGGVMALLGLADEPDVMDATPEMREVETKVPHGAAAELRRLSAWLAESEGLYGDGIIRIEYGDGKLRLEGRNPPRRFPSAAEALAMRRGGEFRITPGGWSVELPAGMPAGARRVPAIDVREVIRRMAGLPHGIVFTSGPVKVPKRVDPVQNTYTRELARTGWRAELGDAAVGELRMLADAFLDMPGTLASADCALGEWRMQSCEVHLEILSL